VCKADGASHKGRDDLLRLANCSLTYWCGNTCRSQTGSRQHAVRLSRKALDDSRIECTGLFRKKLPEHLEVHVLLRRVFFRRLDAKRWDGDCSKLGSGYRRTQSIVIFYGFPARILFVRSTTVFYRIRQS
jgi:hypothetical protein